MEPTVCDSSPMKNLYSMLTRKTDSGRLLGAHQALGIEEAISAMTIDGRYREMGYVRIPDADWTFKLINKPAEPAAQDDPDLRLTIRAVF